MASQNTSQISDRSHFATTRWSLVIAAGGQDDPSSEKALAELCQAYWYPVYAYIRRRLSEPAGSSAAWSTHEPDGEHRKW